MPDNAYDELNLPYSLEAEQAVLGAILMEPDCINQVADVLRPEHFYLPEHQAIFRVMTRQAHGIPAHRLRHGSRGSQGGAFFCR